MRNTKYRATVFLAQTVVVGDEIRRPVLYSPTTENKDDAIAYAKLLYQSGLLSAYRISYQLDDKGSWYLDSEVVYRKPDDVKLISSVLPNQEEGKPTRRKRKSEQEKLDLLIRILQTDRPSIFLDTLSAAMVRFGENMTDEWLRVGSDSDPNYFSFRFVSFAFLQFQSSIRIIDCTNLRVWLDKVVSHYRTDKETLMMVMGEIDVVSIYQNKSGSIKQMFQTKKKVPDEFPTFSFDQEGWRQAITESKKYSKVLFSLDL